MQKRRRKRDILRRLWKVAIDGLELTRDLFPNWIGDHDFELSDYVDFLDGVGSREDLLRGLRQLDPFVDDALASAEAMTDEEFPVFKAALAVERQIKPMPEQRMQESIMPSKFYPILLPTMFMSAKMIADDFETSLEIALRRMYELQLTDAGDGKKSHEEVVAVS